LTASGGIARGNGEGVGEGQVTAEMRWLGSPLPTRGESWFIVFTPFPAATVVVQSAHWLELHHFNFLDPSLARKRGLHSTPLHRRHADRCRESALVATWGTENRIELGSKHIVARKIICAAITPRRAIINARQIFVE
jgi:hypothetical protein